MPPDFDVNAVLVQLDLVVLLALRAAKSKSDLLTCDGVITESVLVLLFCRL